MASLRNDGLLEERGSRCGTTRGASHAALSAEKFGELVVAPLLPRPLVVRGQLRLAGTQLDTTDLAADGLRQLGELDAAYPLPGREVLPGMAQDGQGGLPVRLPARRQHDER